MRSSMTHAYGIGCETILRGIACIADPESRTVHVPGYDLPALRQNTRYVP